MIVTVTNAENLIKAVRDAETMNITKIIIDADEITLTAPVHLPKKLKALSKQLIIDGCGTTIKAGVPMPYMIGRPQPVDANEANNVMQSHGFNIENMFLDCKGIAEYGILMRCTYHDLIKRVTVISAAKGGIIEEFGMNCLITLCETRNISGIGIGLHNGTYTGAGFNKSGSNMGTVDQCRSFPKQGQIACFSSTASGNTAFIRCTVDAATNQTPQRGFYVVNDGSTTCKSVRITDFWAETLTTIAMIDLSLTGGYAHISGGYLQYGGVMVRAQGTNYSEVHIERYGNIPGSAKFEAIDQDTCWYFGANAVSYDFTNPTNWLYNSLPGKYWVEGFHHNKEWSLRAKGATKLNGKNILTQV